MKSFLIILVSILVVTGCTSSINETQSSGLVIKEISPDKSSALAKQNLLQLTQVYELSPFIYTKNIRIQSDVTSHSHLVITLNTKNADNPKKLLSQFLHEQLHWWTQMNHANAQLAMNDLKKYFPEVPVKKGETAESTYLHLIICFLEYKALGFYIGEKDSKKIINEFKNKDKIYPWVYTQVLNKEKTINWAVKKNKILPPILF